MEIGKKLKELRLQNDLTLRDLASRSELTKGFLSQVERGQTTPSIATLEDILEALGSNLSDFFREEEETQIVFPTQDFFVDEQEHYTIEWIILTLHSHRKSQVISSYQGQEFGYVLKGSVTIVQEGGRKYKVKAQETFYMDGSKSHYLYNHGAGDAKILWITTPPVF